jgi:hypothetical protein
LNVAPHRRCVVTARVGCAPYLAQRVEHLRLVLGELVEEERTGMASVPV